MWEKPKYLLSLSKSIVWSRVSYTAGKSHRTIKNNILPTINSPKKSIHYSQKGSLGGVMVTIGGLHEGINRLSSKYECIWTTTTYSMTFARKGILALTDVSTKELNSLCEIHLFVPSFEDCLLFRLHWKVSIHRDGIVGKVEEENFQRLETFSNWARHRTRHYSDIKMTKTFCLIEK